MVDDAALDRAARKAEALVKEMGAELPVDPIAIARDRSIIVEPKPSSAKGVSGMLVRKGSVFGIMYATHIRSEGFQRFSVAHELGHYFLEGHMDAVLPEGDGFHESQAGFVSKDWYEMEADSFAAGLLMPGHLFDAEIACLDDGLGAVEEMQAVCRTSLTATAIRYARRARTCMAVVMSRGRAIEYCVMSPELKDVPGLQWRKGERVPAGTVTQRFNQTSANVAAAERADGEGNLQDWFGGARAIPSREEVVGLGRYGKTLTVITTDLDTEDGDEDAELEESWTPQLRR